MIKSTANFNLPVIILKEGDSFIAYTPALDISTVGKTFEQAQKRFNELVTIFFEELSQAGTTEEVLSDLGWTKEKKQLTPPIIVSNQTMQFNINKPTSFTYA